MTRDRFTEDELQAWVDRHLDATRSAEVEAWLDANPDAAKRWRAYRRDMDVLHGVFDPVLAEPVQDRLNPAAIRARTWRPLAARAAAAVLLVALGAAGGWLARGDGLGRDEAAQTLPKDAVLAHRVFVAEVRHPVEVAADQEVHLVAWLSKRLGRSIKAPHLTGQGFELMGGRLLAAAGGPAAQLMYQNSEGRRLTLYVRGTGGGDTAFRIQRANGVSAFYWIDRGMGYALIGDLERGRLLDAANAVYRELTEYRTP
ncbi:MAG: hypothetical protein COW30_17345 [Rhodospirillales bacterium CG15_BIG_FIL_POST_REV_8_21_14_020_66_15]|nr:MAG: hypothetical protein COW30_17345 [Rhodospirillales bacterium CG15_BIG_FIL_POST_REV_8_21_14_020_66_15]